MAALQIETIPTTPIADQKPGTSGLRKKVAVFQQPHYLANYVQCIFDSLPAEERQGCTLLVSGDGRFYNLQAIQTICEIAAANGYARVWIGKGGLVSTPAASAIIRERENGVASGGLLLTASHNPGGPENDFGCKYNISNGSPAPDSLTDKIYELTKTIKEYKKVKLTKIDMNTLGVQNLVPGKFVVEVIDAVEDWCALMKRIFDFDMLKRLVKRNDFHFVFDGMSGVAGPYAKRVFVDELGAPASSLHSCDPKEDFNGHHPDPNLTYAKDLVKLMHPLTPADVTSATPSFGAAADGDADRNMILGKGFFVSPGDSVAIITCYAQRCIPYFSHEKIGATFGVSRSMPTSCALDNVSKKMGLPIYETPTGWKYFGNLMEAGKVAICGEESFGTGSNHIREKDGLWAVLAWLSILAFRNQDTAKPLVTVQQIVEEFWGEFGRNYYARYDYEEVDTGEAKQVMDGLLDLGKDIKGIPSKIPKASDLLQKYPISKIDSFTYTDPIDKSVSSNQGIRCLLADGSRMVWRLSGTGSTGATVRIYLERFSKENCLMQSADALKDVAELALELCRIKEITKREKPSVIT